MIDQQSSPAAAHRKTSTTPGNIGGRTGTTSLRKIQNRRTATVNAAQNTTGNTARKGTMTTTTAQLSTRRDTTGAALGLTAVAAAGITLAALIVVLLTNTTPGLFHPAAITGHPTANPAAIAATGFPYRHLTVQPDSQIPGQATVTLDNGTGQPDTHLARSLPFDGSPHPTDPATACDTDTVCWGDWTITPALDVTITTTYQGATCTITGAPDTRTQLTCDGYTLPNG